MNDHKLNDKFDSKDFEDKLYKEWEEKGYFKPKMDEEMEPYCIMMPPPNVTGKLHMGHALDDTLQDILIRYKRMKGFDTLWLPGTDHAAIATEVKVVAKMKKEEGLTKDDITREQFLERAWAWTKEYGGTIQNQQRRLGCSCDWDRTRFTMDEGLSEAVLEQFIRLYEKGLIYKGKRMINWCPSCHTSISDAEVEFEEEPSHLWHIRYQIKGTDKYVIVATTRPETMLGDTAVAVHPDDERYKDIVGKTCILPIMNKEIPIIADPFVEKEFGTGCVKITPAHDMNDYQAGKRNNLEFVEVFDDNSIMLDLVPEYKGMKAIDAREPIVEKLKELGALVKVEDYTHNVGKCYRCHNTIEPRISDQWFVKMDGLAKVATDAVRNDEVRFVPKRYEKNYFNWLDNIQDWCISRQLWWGHRIPAYYCDKCGEIHVGKEAPEKCSKCGSTSFTQDPDSLDTWFSSALWPFSTLGWPHETEDYKRFYPTNVLVTGYDIITFWVSRMMTQSIELTGKHPFKDILVHGIVRDSQGRKMSKSLGNGIDPIEIIDQYGTDALRFSLILGTSAGNDIRYMPEKLDQASNFANKLWNASKFVLMNLEDAEDDLSTIDIDDLKTEDKWIISKITKLMKEVEINIENYDLGVALDKIYSFIWNEFCDWYIEIVKPRLYDKENESRYAAQYTLNRVLKSALKLLHPFMPFITEEIYLKLYDIDESIMISSYSDYQEGFIFEKEEEEIELLKKIITEIRNVRTTMNVHPSKKSELIFVTKDYKDLIEESKEFLLKLGFGEKIIIEDTKKDISDNAVSILNTGLDLYIPFEDLVNIEEEIERLENEKAKYMSEVKRSEGILSNENFLAKAPKEKVDLEKEKLNDYKEKLESVNNRLEALKK